MVVTNASTGRPFATKYAQQVFGRDRETIETAWPGDVVGLVNAAALGVGDTLYADQPVSYPPVTTFAPEHFAVARVADTSKYKQFRKGVDTLAGEGVVQVLTSDRRGDGAPVFAVVGPMQFEVASHRMEHEFGAKISLEPLPYHLARMTDEASAPELGQARGAEVMRRPNGELLALFTDKWSLGVLAQNKPHLTLVPLVAAELG
jgi:peptide chain release factor 3